MLTAVNEDPAQNLRHAWEGLNQIQRENLQRRWGPFLQEIFALSEERDPQIFREGLLLLGNRLESRDRLNEAALVYSALRGDDGIAVRAQRGLDAILGVGAAGPRAEFLLRRLAQESTRPEMLLAMGVAGGAFRLTRLATTARLAESIPNALALRATANATGFLAESLAFTASAKLGGAAFGGEQDWSPRAWAREWAGGAAMLLGLRAMGGLSNSALRRWAQGPGTLETLSRGALPQLAMFGGVFLANRLEEATGLRPHRDGATETVDTFATLLQFHIGGRLFREIAGARFEGIERAWDFQTERLQQSRGGRGTPQPAGWNTWSWGNLSAWAGAAEGKNGDWSMMSANGYEEGEGSIAGTSRGTLEAQAPETGDGAATEPKSGNNETGNGTPAENAEPASDLPARPDPKRVRYHFADTEYLRSLHESMTLTQAAGYSNSQRRADLVGTNMRRSLLLPLSGPLEYSPYGAGLVELMRENPQATHFYTGKWERALVASPGTAILGLGSAPVGRDRVLPAEIADPIMQGKSKYFLWTAGVSADPLCIRSYFTSEQLRALEAMEPRQADEQARIWRAERFAETVRAIAPNYGFINIEDAQGKDLPLIFGVLESLRGDTAIWSDDMQGTGVITAAAMLSWAELTGRLDSRSQMPGIRGVIFGAGAGAMGVYNELVNHGVQPENILVTDSRGLIHEGRHDVESDPFKLRMREGIPEGTKVEDFARGADFVINLGVKESFTDDLQATQTMIRHLGFKPFFGPMTNPEPGITPEMLREVRPDAFYGSGNQVYENPVNNFTAFGYIGAGALMARAGGVGPAMTVAAARGIFEVAKLGPPREWLDRLPPQQREFGKHWLVPRPDDLRLIHSEAAAVARAAAREGLAILLGQNPSPQDLARFDAEIDAESEFRRSSLETMREQLVATGRDYLARRYPTRYAPFALRADTDPVYEVAPEIATADFQHFASELGLSREAWQDLLTSEGTLQPTALTQALNALRPATEAGDAQAKLAFEELRNIQEIAALCPALGLALAVQRSQLAPEQISQTPTLLQRPEVRRLILNWVPEAVRAISP